MSGNQALRQRPPDIGDMFIAGLELRDAHLLKQQIERNPHIDPEVWWQMLNLPAPSS